MSRSGYTDGLDNWKLIQWRGQVASAIRGRRGQEFLRDLIAALDALPDKMLIADELRDADGHVCAIGALGVARGIDLNQLDPEDYDAVAEAFNIAHQLAQEVAWLNDEVYSSETPDERFKRMRAWAATQLHPSEGELPPGPSPANA